MPLVRRPSLTSVKYHSLPRRRPELGRRQVFGVRRATPSNVIPAQAGIQASFSKWNDRQGQAP